MGVEQLLDDYNIPYITEGHKHSTEGWSNIHCPFCGGSQDFHLGIHEDMTGCHCWRCGGHSLAEVLSKILDIPYNQSWVIIEKYKTGAIRKKVEEPRVSINPFKFPEPHTKLNKFGAAYLKKRGLDPAYIKEQWGVRQTGPSSYLDGISYGNRLLIPIKWDNKIVSFQSRDITGRSPKKYLVCPMKREVIHHKNILYGNQEYLEKAKNIIIVEGVVDVWKFGLYSCATFGTSFKMEQVLQLAKYDARFFIVFDNELTAQIQARKLMIMLRTMGKITHLETVPDDPGNMNSSEANYFVTGLMNRRY